MHSIILLMYAIGALAVSPTALHAVPGVNASAQTRVTAKHIDFFLSLVFGDEPVAAARRRLVVFADTATVYFRGASDADRKNLVKAMDEINTIMGRTLYVLVPDSNAMVKVSVVKPQYYVDLVPSESKNLFTHYQNRWDGRGIITSATIVMKDNMPNIEKLRTLRRNLARAAGFQTASDFEKRSMLYKSGTEAYNFEPMDQVVMRMLADNADLRGKPLREVRVALQAKYLGAPISVAPSAESSALRDKLKETSWSLSPATRGYFLDTIGTLWSVEGASVSIRAPRTTPPAAVLASKEVDAAPLHGDTLIVYADIRARGMKKAAVFVTAFDADKNMVDGRVSREFKTSINWIPINVALVVPPGATSVAFGPMIEGIGEVEVRQFKVEVRKSRKR